MAMLKRKMSSSRLRLGSLRGLLLLMLLAAPICGCSTSKQQPAGNLPPEFSNEARQARAALDTQMCSNPKVIEIWKHRTENPGEFTLGPGDVLQVSSPNVNELKDRVVSLYANWNVSLPRIGDIKLSWLTEKEAKAAIERKLGDYMYHPEVTVFVQTYHSRQVAVVGSVANPGMFTLSPDDTIESIIQRAGGMSRDAAQEILFTPAVADASQKIEGGTIRENAGPIEGVGAPKTAALAARGARFRRRSRRRLRCSLRRLHNRTCRRKLPRIQPNCPC